MTATSRPAPAQAMPSSIPTNPPPATTSSASSAMRGGWVCRRPLSSTLLRRDPCRLALCCAALMYIALRSERGRRAAVLGSANRSMNIHEYQAKELLAKFGVPVPPGGVAYTAAEAVEVARRLGCAFGLSAPQVNKLVEFMAALYRAFTELDAALLEINPLVLTADGELVALDAKVGFDDNALFRHADVEALRDEDEEDPIELEAGKHALNYVKLDGNIGCMVNGAGLAMATMDIIKFFGGAPANFLDVGGGATRERVIIAFKLILSDPNVEAILVNIFGGIMRCDVIAEGIVAAACEVNLHVPLVVRLDRTNVELGRRILSQSGLPLLAAENFEDAAKKVVDVVKEAA